MNLYIRKEGAPINKEDFFDALKKVEEESEGLEFKKLGELTYNAIFWGKDMCGIDYTDEGQISISTNSKLTPYANYLAVKLAARLNSPIFDPQTMKDLVPGDLKVDLPELKRQHQETFKDEPQITTYDVYNSDIKPYEFNFLIDHLYSSLCDLPYRGYEISTLALKDTDNEVDRFVFRVDKRDNEKQLINFVEFYLSSPKQNNTSTPPLRQVKVTVKNPQIKQQIEKTLNYFSRRNKGLSTQEGFTFIHSTEPNTN